MSYELKKQVEELQKENKVLRESMTKVKIRSYELGQRKMHEMLLKSVQKVQESD